LRLDPTPTWWRRHWEKSGQVSVEPADRRRVETLLHWNEVCLRPSGNGDMNENKMLRADAGRNLSFTRVVARRK